jgi:DNA (cytosine-5)-methyltransferase 1
VENCALETKIHHGKQNGESAGKISKKNNAKSSQHTSTNSLESSKAIPVLSFFTGAGLLDLGFMEKGFEVVWRNEFNPAFARGFEHAMSVYTGCDSHKINNKKSIEAITANEVIEQAFGEAGEPVEFGIIGGPPCTDFSVAGKNHGGDGINGKLAKTYVDLILDVKPHFFILENVKGLFDTKKHKPFLDKLIESLEAVYLTDSKVLNALEYGVPQNRERGFLVGFRRDWLKKNSNFKQVRIDPNPKTRPSWFPWTEAKYPNAKRTYGWPSRAPENEVPEKPLDIPEDIMIGTHICPEGKLESMANGKDCFKAKSKKFSEILEGDDKRKSFKRLHRWRYSPTAAYGNNEVHLHPYLPRRLSVREVMKIQSVPDKYELPDTITLSHKFKMIGNGVPVKLAAAVAGACKKMLDGNFIFKSQPDQILLFPGTEESQVPKTRRKGKKSNNSPE